MSDFPKKIKKQVRELVGTAYARELSLHLAQLAQKFDVWQKNEINCWDLEDAIHKFHNGIARDLYKTYEYCGGDKIHLVARALNLNFLNRNEISDEVFEWVDPMLKYYVNEDSEDVEAACE